MVAGRVYRIPHIGDEFMTEDHKKQRRPPIRTGFSLTYLRAWREWRVMSQAELARRAKVSKVTVARIEGGQPAVYQTVEKLAKALDVTREQLVRREPSERTDVTSLPAQAGSF
jgi:ribosome-binding protein aMBF1 (putative translation factor)